LIRGDFRASQRALVELKNKTNRCPLVKGNGLHQIAQQLRDPGKLFRFTNLVAMSDACLGTTAEAAEIFVCCGGKADTEHVTFIPTPYPVGDTRWDFRDRIRSAQGFSSARANGCTDKKSSRGVAASS